MDLYPDGKELLWMAVYRRDPKVGAPDGMYHKLSGTLTEAAAEAERIGQKEGAILQMLKRRY